MRIFGLKTDEVMGGWRKLHYEELHDLSFPPSIIIKSRGVRWVGHVAQRGKNRNVYRLQVGEPERKIPLGRPKYR
jgi:hypothetical protein